MTASFNTALITRPLPTLTDAKLFRDLESSFAFAVSQSDGVDLVLRPEAARDVVVVAVALVVADMVRIPTIEVGD